MKERVERESNTVKMLYNILYLQPAISIWRPSTRVSRSWDNEQLLSAARPPGILACRKFSRNKPRATRLIFYWGTPSMRTRRLLWRIPTLLVGHTVNIFRNLCVSSRIIYFFFFFFNMVLFHCASCTILH